MVSTKCCNTHAVPLPCRSRYSERVPILHLLLLYQSFSPLCQSTAAELSTKTRHAIVLFRQITRPGLDDFLAFRAVDSAFLLLEPHFFHESFLACPARCTCADKCTLVREYHAARTVYLDRKCLQLRTPRDGFQGSHHVGRLPLGRRKKR